MFHKEKLINETPTTEETLTFLVTAATAFELCGVFEILPSELKNLADGALYDFSFQEKKLTALITGVGTINTALHLTKALMQKKYAGVIHLGIAGSYKKDIFPLATCCYIEKEIWAEYGIMQENNCASATDFPMPCVRLEKEHFSSTLINDVERNMQILKLHMPKNKVQASALTLNAVSASEKRACLLEKEFSADIEIMEGFATAQTCKYFDTPYIHIRAISNIAGVRDKKQWQISEALSSLKEQISLLFA